MESSFQENKFMRHMNKKSAFTLIELLMVIAIIGILAGILIPTVGAVRKQANIAASKAQLSNYVNAIGMFKSEYKFYPDFGGSDSGDSYTVSLNSTGSSTAFIKTMSARDTDGSPISASDGKSLGNRRKIAFHSFSESEFWMNDSDVVSTNQLADRFNNININIEIDGDGDGFVKPTGATQLRTPVTAYVEADDELGAPDYALWD
jgi:prepilin-type N-terminal cleavage/methylation domain-containing protein